jgi:hypothetical protein
LINLDTNSGGRSQILANLLFIVCLGLLFFTRYNIFIDININNVDSDQPLIWLAASDYSKGLFFEPRFYGQDYNTNMEGLFAVPLIWAGVPVYIAVPMVTHFIFLFPYLFTAFWFFFNKHKFHALLVLAVLLCMPTPFDILTSLPRGFVTGLFFCSFFILSINNPLHRGYLILNTLMAIVGYFVNPNSVVASIPVLFYLFLHNYRDKKYYIATACCLLLVIPLYLLLDKFYDDHPEYIVYGLFYHFSWDHFVKNLANLHVGMVHISFFTDKLPFALPLCLLVLTIMLYRYNRRAFWSILICYAIVIASCASGKTGDGTDWAFYSASRMYLALPILFFLFFFHLPIHRIVISVIISVTLLFSIYKFVNYRSNLEAQLKDDLWVGVHLNPMKGLLHAMEHYKNQCEMAGVNDLIISNAFWLSSYLAYGAPAIFPDYPSTQETNSERRYKVREAGKTKYVKRFMFLASKYNIHEIVKTRDFELQVVDGYGLYIVNNNRLSMNEFGKLMRAVEYKLYNP